MSMSNSNSNAVDEDKYELKCQPTDSFNELNDEQNNVLVSENKTINDIYKKGIPKSIEKILLIVFVSFIFLIIILYFFYDSIMKFFTVEVEYKSPKILKGGKRR
jgi:hypothetical protein